ncbi:MAG: retropepsin-like domain-containing protein [Lentisphaeraceae bacterium]|nr:retropepsin-like domain-containing protein [Lentisphaeraceae bacterium]
MKVLFAVLIFIESLCFAKTLDSEGLPVSELKFPLDKNEVQLPLLSGRGLYFTDAVSINGTPVGVFLIDTASNISILDKEFAEDSGLSRTLEGMSDVVGKQKYRFLRIEKLGVGAIEIKNHLIYTQDLTKFYSGFKRPIVGVIGGDILGKMPFALDFAGKSLTFYKNASFLPTGKSLPLKIRHRLSGLGIFSKANEFSGVPQVNVIINKYSQIPLIVDSGDSDFVNLRANVALSNTALAGRYRLPRMLAESGATQQYNALLKQAEIGDYNVEPVGLSYIIFPHVQNSPAESAVGTGFLQSFRLTFDYSQGRVWLSKSDNQKFSKIDFAGHTQLARALRAGDVSRVKEILAAGEERYFNGLRGENYLIMAAQASEPFSVDVLLKYGRKDINFFDKMYSIFH